MPLCARNDGKKNIKSRRMQEIPSTVQRSSMQEYLPMQTYSTIPLVIPLCGEVRMSLKTIVLIRATTKNVKITSCLTPHMSYPTPNRFTVYTLSPQRNNTKWVSAESPNRPRKDHGSLETTELNLLRPSANPRSLSPNDSASFDFFAPKHQLVGEASRRPQGVVVVFGGQISPIIPFFSTTKCYDINTTNILLFLKQEILIYRKRKRTVVCGHLAGCCLSKLP